MEEIRNIPKEKFRFASDNDISHDKRLETKPIGYFRDAFRRFCKNKGSVVAAIIVLILILFAIVGPFCISPNYVAEYETGTSTLMRYQYLLPKVSLFEGTGFWDGTTKKTGINEASYYRYRAIEEETGYKAIVKELSTTLEGDEIMGYTKRYTLRIDAYHTISSFTVTLTTDKYEEIMSWQDENDLQVIMPYVNNNKGYAEMTDTNVWYVCNQKGSPTLTEDGEFIPAYYTYATVEGRKDDYTSKMRLEKDPYLSGDTQNGWSYAQRTGTATTGYNYVVRVNAYNYFLYKYGFEPCFTFGTDANGYDIFTRLASGARFSMLFALAVSAINLTIGAIYGAIEGYYGGKTDLIMERISDILSSLPTMVITILFNLHLSAKIGVVPALLYAFVLTGWIGMASTTRMQFYRFKNQEYVLAARTLGARDRRLIWKHIFPNALGTIITSCVLVIPSVIFSETSLTYLGIINLDSPTRSSVGAMLSAGRGMMVQYPHLILFPALFIALLMISFNLFGNGLRDAFNPSLRGTEG